MTQWRTPSEDSCSTMGCHSSPLQLFVLVPQESAPHLSKRPSDLKQNGTQEKTPFSGTVFHTLSHGVLRFVASVSFKNHWIEAPWLAVKEFQPVRRWFFELTLATKRITPCERAWKTVLENGVFSCVPFCLRSLGCFERCGTRMRNKKRTIIWYKKYLLVLEGNKNYCVGHLEIQRNAVECNFTPESMRGKNES